MKTLFNKKVMSWAMYDCANSVFFTTVMAGFFPLFFKLYWSSESSASESTERLGWILAISGFLLAVVSPLLGAVSDKKKSKKKFLFGFMLLGVISVMGLYFVQEGDWSKAAVLYGTAMFACTASIIFYDSLLVSVTEPKNYDRVSSFGYAVGYLAGGVVFALNVAMYLKPEFFGISSGSQAILISFLMTGAWWVLFSLPLMLFVPEPNLQSNSKTFGDSNTVGYKLSINDSGRDGSGSSAPDNRESVVSLFISSAFDLVRTFKEISKNKNIRYFLIAYWFYIDGVSTVMSMAVDFGASLNLESAALIQALLLTQFVGFPAAYITGNLAYKWGNKTIIMGSLAIYIVVVIGASQMTREIHFYVMAGLIGLAQGAAQALSRSLFAQLIPAEKSGEYFGFFNLIGKFAAVIGPLLIALTARFTQDSRMTILSLLVLFIAGSFFLQKVKVKKVV